MRRRPVEDDREQVERRGVERAARGGPADERRDGAGGFGPVYLVASMLLGGIFIAGAVVLYRRADRRSALRLYLYSLAYLALLFAAMVVDAHV